MARPTGTGAPGAGAENTDRRVHRASLSRSSFFTLPPDPPDPNSANPAQATQTQGREEDIVNKLLDENNQYRKQHKKVFDQLQEIEEEEAETELNLADLCGHEFIEDETEDEGAGTSASAPERRVTIDNFQEAFDSLNGLNADKFKKTVNDHPQAIHKILCDIESDHRRTHKLNATLEMANRINLRKAQDAKDQMDRLEDAIGEEQAENTTLKEEITKLKEEIAKHDNTINVDPDELIQAKADTAKATEAKKLYRTQCKAAEAKLVAAEERIAELEKQKKERGRSKEKQDPPPQRTESEESLERRQNGGKPNKPQKSGKPTKNNGDPDSSDSSDDEDGDKDKNRKNSRKSGSRERASKKTDSDGNPISAYTTYDANMTTGIKSSTEPKAPTKFDPKSDDIKFQEWQRAAEAKLQASKYRTVKDSLQNVQSWLKNGAWTYVDSKIPSLTKSTDGTTTQYASVDEMMEDLAKRYGTRNAHANAMTKLNTLQQGDKEKFSDFYPSFRENADIVNLDNGAEEKKLEKDFLLRKLNARYDNRIMNEDTAKMTLEQVVSALYDYEDKFEAYDLKHGKTSNKTQGDKKNTKGGDDKKDSTSSGGGNTNTTTNPNAKTKWADRPQQYQHIQPLDATRAQECIDQNRCLKCEEEGHRRVDTDQCPLRDVARRPFAPGYNPSNNRRNGGGNANNNGGAGNA